MRAVHHLALECRDLERSRAFYVGVLGLSVQREHHDEAGLRSIWLDLEGGAFLALERARIEGPRRLDGTPGLHCVAFAIGPGERASWRARLQSAGLAVERETGYTLYVRDPDAVLVGLSHHPEACT